MVTLVSFLIQFLCSWGCYKLALKQSRNTTLASVLGFAFGIFAIIGYLIAGNKKIN